MCHALGEVFTNIMVFQGYTVDTTESLFCRAHSSMLSRIPNLYALGASSSLACQLSQPKMFPDIPNVPREGGG